MKKILNKDYKHFIKNKCKKIIFYFLIFSLFLINFAILHNFSGDNYINYGFAYNIATGMLPYKDFNMILFPFSSFLMALILKIFGTKLIVYYIFYSLIFTLIIHVILKLNKNAIPFVIFFLLISINGGYNALCLFLFLLLLWLLTNSKNDYLIGLILGLLIVTNQKMVVLFIPTILTKDWHKIIKRISVSLLPLVFEFGSKNFNKMFVPMILELLIIIFLIYKYIKNHDLMFIYLLAFQIIALPILDPYHVIIAFIPFICYFYYSNAKTLKIINSIFIILTIGIFSYNFINILKDDRYYLNLNNKSNLYLTISDKDIDYINKRLTDYYYQNIKKYDNIYFLYNDMYYHKLKNKIPINKFDLILNGNNGYQGNNNLKKTIKKMKNSLFIVNISNDNNPYDLNNYEIIEFVSNNYSKLECLSKNFCVYEIKN